MPHSWNGGFYTTAPVAQAPDVNHVNNNTGKNIHTLPAISQNGQNTANQNTHNNDQNKQ